MRGLLNARNHCRVALAEGPAVLLGGHQPARHQQGHPQGAVMTSQERELMLAIRQQQVLGQGMFLTDTEFKAWACKNYNISESRLTELQKEVLAS